MPKVVVIGATGHVGTYLVPRLVEAGHEVVAVSRGQQTPYRASRLWDGVERLMLDREALEGEGAFGARIAALEADIVIDMICFTLESATQLADALRGRVGHFLHCGTIWTHGFSRTVPAREEAAKAPFGEYGLQKRAIELFLLDRARREGFPATLIHPGHIVGTGWAPLNPQGNFNLDVFSALARGQRLPIANFGLETVHHVHADDVAQLFMRAIESHSASVGEAFHAVSEQAITLRYFAEAMAAHFGQEARLEFLGWDDFKSRVGEDDAGATWEHIARSPSCSIEKGRARLGYAPRYTSLEAVRESVDWLVGEGRIKTAS